MAFLENFSVEERALLISLPYRVGLWVSKIDRTGDPGADEGERAALERIIAREARGMFHSAFVHEVMAENWAAKAGWSQWDNDLDRVPAQCAEATRLVSRKLARHDLDAYRATLIHIALEVAKAFREAGSRHPLLAFLWLKLLLWRGRLAAFFRREPYDPVSVLNISPMEDRAIVHLAQALSVGAAVAAEIPDAPK